MSTRKFPTKRLMEEAKIHNSHNIASLTKDKIFICFTPAMTGRGSFPAGYSIVHIGHKTDPKGHWRDYGDKTFNIGGRADKEEALAEAIAWANERFGKREWVRDPYGSYQEESAIEAVLSEIKRINVLKGKNELQHGILQI